MDLGHGFLPRIDARNYKAVERCLPRDGPGLFNVGLDLPWAILEGPWALQRGASTIELCRDRGSRSSSTPKPGVTATRGPSRSKSSRPPPYAPLEA